MILQLMSRIRETFFTILSGIFDRWFSFTCWIRTLFRSKINWTSRKPSLSVFQASTPSSFKRLLLLALNFRDFVGVREVSSIDKNSPQQWRLEYCHKISLCKKYKLICFYRERSGGRWYFCDFLLQPLRLYKIIVAYH